MTTTPTTSTSPATPTPVHSRDVEPSTRRGGKVRMLLSPGSGSSSSGLSGTVTLEPDHFVIEHYHPYSEEHVLVIRGSLIMRVDGVDIPIGPGDALCVPIGVRHRLVNTGSEPAEVVFHLSPLAPEPRLGHVDTEPADPLDALDAHSPSPQ